MAKLLLGIDVGGTFTDFVAYDPERRTIAVWKHLTTPADPVDGILKGLAELNDPATVDSVRLGTTIVTNALLERSGATVGYIATEGFRDIPFMQRGHRRGHYDASWVKSEHFVQRRHAYDVAERIGPDGDVLMPLDEAQLRAVARHLRDQGEVQAVALCFLHCYASPVHERRARDILNEELPDLPVSISFDVMPRWKEYERASTTIADAYVKPLVSRQIRRLRQAFDGQGLTSKVVMIKSNGGEMALDAAANTPIHLAVSGPTGGVIAAKHLAPTAGIDNLVTLDMGGTSTDCATVIAGEEVFTTDFEVEFGIPVQVPMIDIRSIGAGGGSIAWIDKGGMLRVGPQSARAVPGPACYGRGGRLPTTTDANVMLGRLDPENFLGGRMPLDATAAERSVAPIAAALDRSIEATALAIVQIANNNMVALLRSVLTERGLDPRDFTLLAYGGAGPLHVGDLMRAFEVADGIVPNHPAQFSAFGFIMCDARVDRHRTVQMESRRFDGERATLVMQELVADAVAELRMQGYAGEPRIARFIEARYVGQNYEIELSVEPDGFAPANAAGLWESFHRLHETRFGFSTPGEAIEMVNLKITVTIATPGPDPVHIAPGDGVPTAMRRRRVYFTEGWFETPVYDRAKLGAEDCVTGPALIEEAASVTVLCPQQELRVDETGNLCLNDSPRAR